MGVFLMLPINSAQADNNNATFQSMDIQDATLLPLEDGVSAILRFSINNETSEVLTLLGTQSKFFAQSEIMVKLSESKTERLASLSISGEEALDLTTNHMFIKLSGGRKGSDLPPNITMRLLLISGEVEFVAHVLPSL
ncbi:hypothetical protein A9Q83_17440 [Alphaproteobacteria bacterium 46_93_T64]|nr:hypothetical protein A9Q83_17440 [Alphaproteobacteria bacterium 46_93_T64]